MVKHKLFFCFPLDGPNNGVKIISNHIYDYLEQNEKFHLIRINTSQAGNFKNFGTFNIQKLIDTVKLYWIMGKIKKNEYAYVNLTPKGYAFYRDILFVGICKLKRANTTLHIHANGLENKLNFFSKWLLKNVKIIVINDKQYSKIARNLPNIYIIPNALPDYFANKVSNMVDEGVYRPKLLFFSNLSKEKGIVRLRTIIEQLNKSDFLGEVQICGGVLNQETEDIMEKLVMENTFVSFHGPVLDEDQKFNFFSNSDFLLLLSDENYEVSPLVYIEALMSSLPIITTRQVVACDLVENGCAFLLNDISKDIQSIIRDWGTDVDKTLSLRKNCRNLYLAKYSFDSYVENISQAILE